MSTVEMIVLWGILWLIFLLFLFSLLARMSSKKDIALSAKTVDAFLEGWNAHRNETRFVMKEKFPFTYKTINKEIP